MPTRTIKGTIDNFFVNAGSEVTYQGTTSASSTSGLNIRGFRVDPANTGSLIVTLDGSNGVNTMEIFQEDVYNGSTAPAGYKTFANIAKDGRSKGVVAVTVTDATKNYIVLLELDGYSEVAYNGSVVVP